MSALEVELKEAFERIEKLEGKPLQVKIDIKGYYESATTTMLNKARKLLRKNTY